MPRKAKSTASTLASSSSASSSTLSSTAPAWLMKAEPDERMEKGIDISFSVEKFAAMPNRTTPWDGVRNPEAKTMMKEKMRRGDRVLFYHSNCKLPGIAGVAHIVKEGYPDYTAWDAKHPYYDPKTDKDNPKWYMVSVRVYGKQRSLTSSGCKVDVQLERKLQNLVPLALLQLLRDDKSKKLDYLTDDHRDAIRSMQLLNRGRLSVQHVTPLAYDAIVLLGDRGGWLDWPGKWQSKDTRKRKAENPSPSEEENKVSKTVAQKRSTRSKS